MTTFDEAIAAAGFTALNDAKDHFYSNVGVIPTFKHTNGTVIAYATDVLWNHKNNVYYARATEAGQGTIWNVIMRRGDGGFDAATAAAAWLGACDAAGIWRVYVHPSTKGSGTLKDVDTEKWWRRFDFVSMPDGPAMYRERGGVK